jgi:hypothetical protein
LYIIWSIVLTDCEINGLGVILIGPIVPGCQRPLNLTAYSFIIGYTILSGPTVIISSESEETACSSINYINGLPLEDTSISISFISFLLII